MLPGSYLLHPNNKTGRSSQLYGELCGEAPGIDPARASPDLPLLKPVWREKARRAYCYGLNQIPREYCGGFEFLQASDISINNLNFRKELYAIVGKRG
ncbi:hypothetical protein RRG08_047453 [Elysia crispata]|uniref:Uncharacterized protein n=1 Tax=Elysia crispata TaxID=231223 RepID=A0AAE1D4R3_9GAST|nr:hypothetical protein RRG08_047453 [Elysia crispata]